MDMMEVESVKRQREQLLEEIRTLPAEVLQEISDLVLRSRQKMAVNESEHPSEPTTSSPYEAFKEAGLIGCIKDAPPDLSVNYKEYLAKGLAEKYGHR